MVSSLATLLYHGRHDTWCHIFTCDKLCPNTSPSVVPHKPNGKWVKGYSGNLNGPRRLKEARRYIAALCGEGGERIIDQLMMLAGLTPRGAGEFQDPSPAVKVRALVKLADVFYGKEIRKTISGKVQHAVEIQAPRVAQDMSKLSDEELADLESFYAKRNAREAAEKRLLERGKKVEGGDVLEADFEEVPSGQDDVDGV